MAACGGADPVRRHRPVSPHAAAGIADIPDPGDAARPEARDLLAADGAAALHARLAAADPVTAARLRPSDGQRVARAWEVWRGTGRGLAAWQADAVRRRPAGVHRHPAGPATPGPARRHRRTLRRHAAAGRAGGGAALLAQRLDPALPAMQAHGVPELRPTCAARSRWRKPNAGPCWPPAVHQAAGDLVPPSPHGDPDAYAYDTCAI